MPAWQLLLLFFSVLIGGGSGFYFQKEKKGLLQIVLSFSGSYILGIAVLHLMPWVFSGGDHQPGLWILAGFFVQLLLEQLSVGVEHGHIHAPHKFSNTFVLSVMAGLCIHAFVEGMPLSYYGEMHQAEVGAGHTHNHLLYGIILHHIPAAFALVVLLLVSQLQKKWVWLCLFIFAAMSPLGALLADSISIPTPWQKSILAFAVGSLLHISTVILFEMDSSSHHYISTKKLAAIAAGLFISILTIL
ncbi:MAG: ZIP family metal transporter [Lewinellaceae bacterium]|nr:ZIP family metal transporter [Saprospiraceae bacterium]MCB9341179.1 ZIP family metal transporter [Lewinellaceae bacterium]